ncbi:MAG: hypothetical protein EOP51_13165 [Sphingobacteriales bacterium]|nr:MAG: hypothetical protein EOP51_13165 [Sphingobacteriales bacterium]
MKQGNLKRLTLILLLLLAVVFVCDRLIGAGLQNLFYKQTRGDDMVSIYTLERSHEDILVLGGSRASHHYKTDVLGSTTGMSCYNGGRDDMPVTYVNAILPVVYQRYNPKVIILDVIPSELIATKGYDQVYQRISTVLLRFAYKHPELFSTIALAGKIEVWKAQVSHIYPYNSIIGSAIQNTYTKLGHESVNGYEPVIGSIDTVYYTKPAFNFNVNGTVDDSLAARYVNIIKLAKEHNTRLITIVSPFYFAINPSPNNSYNFMKQQSAENGCEFYDFSNAQPFSANPNLFYDELHMNDDGAGIYSQIIGNILVGKK